MKSYIMINNLKIALTEEQVKAIIAANEQENSSVRLADIPTGELAKIGGYQFLVLEQLEGTTALICKDLIGDPTQFGENNNYDGSYVDEICNSFSEAIADAAGEDNLISHIVDLTSDDGLKDYGTVEREVSLLTTEQYRKYVDILDKCNPGKWWWLATPHSTSRHSNDSWVKCVSPSGYFYSDGCLNGYGGVRPFCILKSSIFVSR